MTDKISALLEIVAEHKFPVEWQQSGRWRHEVAPKALARVRRILPDAAEDDFFIVSGPELWDGYALLMDGAMERMRKALGGP